jgi:hypothetical protein
VLHLVDCSLLVPPRTGADGRSRYAMLEPMRAYGAGLLAGAGEEGGAAGALAGWAVQVAEEASAGLQIPEGELAAARWLDAEDAALRQVLAWAMEHGPAAALRLAVALGWWWILRGRLAGQYLLLREVASRAEAGSDQWRAMQFWLGRAAVFSEDLVGALSHFTGLRDAAGDEGLCRALADALAGRALVLINMARLAEAADEARRAVAVAQDIGYPAAEVLALIVLSYTASNTGDHDRGVQLARQAGQITAGVPGPLARVAAGS